MLYTQPVLYGAAFIIAFFIALIMTPFSKKIAFKVGAIDQPKARGMHAKPMPRMGGIAIVAGFMTTIFLVAPQVPDLDFQKMTGIIIGGMIIFMLGFFDDIYNLSAKLKLCVQILAAIVVVLAGIRIEFVSWPFGQAALLVLESWSVPITILWIVGVTNAVNFIDGLDGLAAGVSSISALCLMVLSIYSGNITAVVLTATLAGACLGFLPHNFNPATIFMGDTGSTFLGFILAVTSVLGLVKGYTIATIFVAVLVLGLPIFDTAFAIIRRLINRQPVMQADRGHLHHRLVDRGYSQKRAVVTLYGISGGFGITGILVSRHDMTVAVCVFVCMAVLVYLNMKYHKKPTAK